MMKDKTRRLRLAAVVGVAGVVALSGCSAEGPASDGAAADGDCSAFKGKSIDLVIPYDAGGGYDILARDLLPGFENALDATVVPVNKPGAGGLLAINQLTTAPADGTQIAIMNGAGVAATILAGAEGPEFDFDGLSYVGRAAVDDRIVATAADSEYETWEDVQNSDGFRFGSTGRGSADYIAANALIQAFDLKNAEVVTGFNGQPEVELALLQGNVDAIASPLDSRRSGLVGGDTQAVLSFADEPPKEAPDVTLVDDAEIDEEGRTIIEGLRTIEQYARLIVAPPDMDDATLTCLQDALRSAMEDPEVLELAEKTQRALSYMPGKEITDELVPSFDNLSDDFIEVLKSSY